MKKYMAPSIDFMNLRAEENMATVEVIPSECRYLDGCCNIWVTPGPQS